MPCCTPVYAVGESRCDDGSRDGTADLALKLGAQYPQSDVRVVVLEKNIGKGGAVRHGMLHARGRRLLMVDADGASRFEDLELLWSAMDEISPKGEVAVVVGSRAHLVKTEAVVKVRSLSNLVVPHCRSRDWDALVHVHTGQARVLRPFV